MNRLPLVFTLLFALTFLASCGGDDKEPASSVAESSEPTSPAPAAAPVSKERMVWVDDLNVRDAPNAAAKKTGRLKQGDVVTLTGQKSSDPYAAVLRGVLYREPWYEAKMPDGSTGWLFGGALKGARELKGNRPISRTKFNYPYLGEFYLDGWNAHPTEFGDAGDYAGEIFTYEGDGQRLQITEAQGEYGYFTDHILMNTKCDTLKERHLMFDNLTLELTEEVIDYMEAEPMAHRRKQTMPEPYQQMKSRPLMVLGEWSTKAYTDEPEPEPEL